MSEEFNKFAAETPLQIRDAASHIRKLASYALQQNSRAEAVSRELLNHKIARRMEQRDLMPGTSFEQKLAHISQLPETKLAAYEEGIELATGGLGAFGRVQEEDRQGQSSSSSDAQDIDNWILAGGPHS